jgi:hypothetical protein
MAGAAVMPVFLVPLHESNDCHTPAGSPEGGQFCSGAPVAAGSTPIPPGMVRGYHYTSNLDAVLQTGLSTTYARGSTYGEPNVIWFSSQKPHDYKHYVEVFLKPEELGIGRVHSRDKTPTQEEIDRFNQAGGNFTTLLLEIPASRFVTHHRPWHAKFQHLMQEYPPEDLTAPRWQAKLRRQGYTGFEDVLQSFEKIGGEEYGPAVALWAKLVRRAAARRG